ncbi:MAG: diguanylate cyclase [Gaiellaceae bacterium MAG52_C11]|nr:diguanylate cyclase [Candidatus Gaiellasilicea maunaloa]
MKEIRSATPVARVVLVVSAVAVAAVALFATVDGLAERRTEAARAHEARAFAGIVHVVGRQRQLLAPSRRARTTKADISSLSRKGQRLLDDLRDRAASSNAATAAALSVSYRMAARHGEDAVGGQSKGGRERTSRLALGELGAIQGKAEAELRQRQNTVMQAGSPLLDALRILATLIVGLLALVGSVAVVRSRPAAGVGERDAELERLEVEARTDNLTGLGNHRGFHHDLSLEVQRRSQTGSVFSLMAIDLDGLKQINDTQGHQAGDVYIKRVSDLARSAVGSAGTVYRTGGDEFMILLPGSRNWNALALANTIDRVTREALGRRAVSMGLTESTGTEARHLLIHQADVALYEAKRTKLTALTYHSGLTASREVEATVPSHHQRTLAAALARAVDAKDAGTRSHSETVAELAVAMGKALHIDGEGLERLRLAGLLHDVGKIGVADAILQKPAALRLEEEDEMKEHVAIGHGIMLSAELPTEAVWVLHHHERVDGSGYPHGLRADQIPLESRIIAVADAFEAMTGTRPYRESLTVADALFELRTNTDKQFDGRCVEALTDVLAVAPVVEAKEYPGSTQALATQPQLVSVRAA